MNRLTFKDREGVTHDLRVERTADVPGFYLCWTGDGQRMVIHRTDIKLDGKHLTPATEPTIIQFDG